MVLLRHCVAAPSHGKGNCFSVRELVVAVGRIAVLLKMAEATGVSSVNPNAEIVRNQLFEVGPRYTNLAYIGEGAYGMVV